MDITLKTTKNGYDRNVTLWVNKDGSVSLLGNLEHNTTIIVNQELVNNLQKIVDFINNGEVKNE